MDCPGFAVIVHGGIKRLLGARHQNCAKDFLQFMNSSELEIFNVIFVHFLAGQFSSDPDFRLFVAEDIDKRLCELPEAKLAGISSWIVCLRGRQVIAKAGLHNESCSVRQADEVPGHVWIGNLNHVMFLDRFLPYVYDASSGCQEIGTANVHKVTLEDSIRFLNQVFCKQLACTVAICDANDFVRADIDEPLEVP